MWKINYKKLEIKLGSTFIVDPSLTYFMTLLNIAKHATLPNKSGENKA